MREIVRLFFFLIIMKKEVLKLTYPIILQNLIVFSVMAMENVLTARISGAAFSALTLTMQIYNMLSLTFMGIIGGGNIILAQAYGEKDYTVMRKTVRLEFIANCLTTGVICAISAAAPAWVMGLLTKHTELIHLGSMYLRIMGIAWFLASCSMILTSVLRMTGHAVLPTRMAAAEMGLELAATAVIVLVLEFTPEMTLRAMAFSMLVCRVGEFVVLAAAAFRVMRTWQNETVSNSFLRRFVVTVSPVAVTEVVWAIGSSVLVGFVGRQTEAAIAAFGICLTAESLAGVFMGGIDVAGQMVLGQNLTKPEGEIRDLVKILKKLAFRFAVIEMLVFFGMAIVSPYLYRLGSEVHKMAYAILIIDGIIELFKAVQCMNVAGILRAFGDVKFGFLNDFIWQWLWVIPLSWVAMFVLHIPFAAAFFIMKTDQIIKIFTSEWRLRTTPYFPKAE